jgi:hypothetical protein
MSERTLARKLSDEGLNFVGRGAMSKGSHGFDEQIFGAHGQIPERGQTYLNGIGLKVMCEKQRTSTFSHRRRVKRPSLICSAN